MTAYFGRHYSSQVSATSIESRFQIGPGGHGGGTSDLQSAKDRITIGSILLPVGFGPGDTATLCTVGSRDRVTSILYSSSRELSTSTTGDFGVFLEKSQKVILSDLFSKEVLLRANRKQILYGNGLFGIDAGKQLWQMVNELKTDSYTKDPTQNWDIVITGSGEPITSAGDVQVEVHHSTGD